MRVDLTMICISFRPLLERTVQYKGAHWLLAGYILTLKRSGKLRQYVALGYKGLCKSSVREAVQVRFATLSTICQ